MKGAYLTSTTDVRLPYPQMDIVDTSFGANAAAAAAKKVSKSSGKVARTSTADLDAVTQKSSGLKASGLGKPAGDNDALGRERRKR
jgi:hypothetical protein